MLSSTLQMNGKIALFKLALSPPLRCQQTADNFSRQLIAILSTQARVPILNHFWDWEGRT